MVPKCSIMGPKCSPMVPNGTQNTQNVPTWGPNDPQMVPKWSPNGPKMDPQSPLWAIQGSNHILGSILRGIWGQFWTPKLVKKSLKMCFRGYSNQYWFLERFVMILCTVFAYVFEAISYSFLVMSVPKLKKLMFRITPYLQWIFMIFMMRLTFGITKTIRKRHWISIQFLIRF